MFSEQIQTQAFQAFLQKLRSLDLGPIAFQLTKAKGGPQWTTARATQAITHYLAFLYLVHQYPRLQLTPSQEIDQVWHCHILDTSKYAADCQQLFGGFIHHFPYLGMRGTADQQNWHQAYALTQILFRQQFGLELAANEVRSPADCEPLRSESQFMTGCSHIAQPRPSVDIHSGDTLLAASVLIGFFDQP